MATASETSTFGVTVHESFVVGSYTIDVVSGSEGGGLAQWLGDNGFTIEDNALDLLDSYVQEGQRFVVARVETEGVEGMLENDGRGGAVDHDSTLSYRKALIVEATLGFHGRKPLIDQTDGEIHC